MKKTLILTGLIAIIASTALISFYRVTSKKNEVENNFAEALKGNFEIVVSNTGELVPENSVDISGPNVVRNRYFRIRPMKITDLVPEGTLVKKGDYIATVDRTNYDNSLKDAVEELQTLESQLEMKLLDTALTLSALRDDIKNQIFSAEEASIAVDVSKYEPPATQRQAKLELDKSRRVLEQKRRLYTLNVAQSALETRKLRISVQEQSRKVNDLKEILASFTVTSPADGMVAYQRDRTGAKIKTGSMMNPFRPVIATLPDMSSLNSKTYVSEIDINKVKPGQKVEISVDAFRGKSFTGKVASIANIGEVLPNSDSKVFEVEIKLDVTDPSLRPSMTTSNRIITAKYENVIYIPQEALHAGPDSIPFVYTKNGDKQIVIPGRSNDENVVIENGLAAGTPVYLATPENHEKFPEKGTDLIPLIKERNRAFEAAAEKSERGNTVIARTEILPSEQSSEN